MKRSNPSVNTITIRKRNNSIKFQTIIQDVTTVIFSLQFFDTGKITIQGNFVDEWKINELPVLESIVNQLGPLTAGDLSNEDSVKSAILNAHWVNNWWLEDIGSAMDSHSILADRNPVCVEQCTTPQFPEYTPIPLNNADTPSRNENTTSKLTEERKEFLRNKAKSSAEARKVKLDDLIKITSSLQAQMTTVISENNDFKLAFEEQNKIINTLDSKVQNIISENNSLKSSIKEKERNISELHSNLDDLIIENNSLKSKVKELTKNMDRFLNWSTESRPVDGYDTTPPPPFASLMADVLTFTEKTEKIERKVKQHHEEHNVSVQKSAKGLETFFRKQLENTNEDITEKINNIQDTMQIKFETKLNAMKESVTLQSKYISDIKEDLKVIQENDIKGEIRIIKTKQDELEKLLETKSTESAKTTFPNPPQPTNHNKILKELPAHLSQRYDHIVIGDSIVSGISYKRFVPDESTLKISLRGKGIKDVHQYINDKLNNLSEDPSNIFLHVGSNDLQNGTSPENLLTLTEELGGCLIHHFPHSTVIFSSVLNRIGNDDFNQSAKVYNNLLSDLCKHNGFCFSNNSNINTSLNFTSDGVHLNKRYGVPKLARNLCESVGIYVQQTNIAMSHGINHNNGHIRSRETYTSAIQNKRQSDENDARLSYNNHNKFRPSHDNQVNKYMHPIDKQDNRSSTISEIKEYLLLLFDKI